MALNNTQASAGHNGNSGFQTFDLYRVKRLLLKYWYWLALSMIMGWGVAYVYLKYQIPLYRVSSLILLKDEKEGGMSKMELIEGFGLSSEMRNIQNQTFVIRSQKMVRRTIENLDFQVSYWVEGKVKNTELYHAAPYHVEWDTAHVQCVDVDFYVELIDDNTFRLRADGQNGWCYDYGKQTYKGSSAGMIVDATYHFGQPITSSNYSFIINKKPTSNVNREADYYVRFHSIASLVSQYRSTLSVAPYSEGSSIIVLSMVGAQTEKMITFLSHLNSVIVDYNLDKKNDMATRSLTFIQTQLKSVSDSLQRVQGQLTDFRREHSFGGSTGFTQNISSDYFSQEKEHRVLMLQYDYLLYLKDNLSSRPALEEYFALTSEGQTAGGSMAGQLVSQLMTLTSERAQLNDDISKQNPYVSNLDQKIEQVKHNLSGVLSQAVIQMEMKLKESRNLMYALRKEISALPDLERQYVDIERRYKLNDAIYTFLLQKQSENQIAKASNSADNEVLEDPSVVALVAPMSKQLYVRGVLLGLLLPVGLIVLGELLNVKVRTLDELKSLLPNVPVVGVVPIHPDSDDQVIFNNPASQCSEAFRRLRVKMNFLLAGSDKKVILVTSSDMGEGKTFFSYNLASVFAVSGKKTVLVGFDLRRPRLDTLSHASIQRGLSGYLAQQWELEEVISPMKHENMFLIAAGAIPPNPSELIAQQRTKELLTKLRDMFDIIIVDTAPIGIVSDARMLIDYSDTVLFVSRAGISKKEHLKVSVDNLLSENITSIGLVFNGIEQADRTYGYYGVSPKK